MASDSKVLEYETFLNDRLREDLRKILEHRNQVNEDLSEYMQLKITILKFQTDLKPKSKLKTKVDLGCGFYGQVNIPDPSKICVAIGCGFFLEMTLPEALTFIDKKTLLLEERVSELTKDACKVKAHIRLVLEGLRELQNIPAESVKPHRDVLS